MNENTTPEPAEEAVEEVEGVKVSEVVEEPVEEVVPVEEEVRTHRSDGSPFVGEVLEQMSGECSHDFRGDLSGTSFGVRRCRLCKIVEEEEEPLLTLNEVKDRFTGIVNNARAAGIAGVTNRGFAALEGFFGALAGDKDQRPPKR